MISSLPSKKTKENIGMIENLNHQLFIFAMNILKFLTRLPKSEASSVANYSARHI